MDQGLAAMGAAVIAAAATIAVSFLRTSGLGRIERLGNVIEKVEAGPRRDELRKLRAMLIDRYLGKQKSGFLGGMQIGLYVLIAAAALLFLGPWLGIPNDLANILSTALLGLGVVLLFIGLVISERSMDRPKRRR